MKRRMMMMGVLAAAGLLALPSRAGPAALDFEVSLTAGQTAVTQSVPMVSAAFEIDRIVLHNDSAVTAAVAVAALDLGVALPLDTFALAAGGGESRATRLAEITTLQQHVVTGDVAFVRTNVSTNQIRRPLVRDLQVTVSKPTNAVPMTVRGRVFGFGN